MFGRHSEFVKPDYLTKCFSRIPSTVKALLTGEPLTDKLSTRVLPDSCLPPSARLSSSELLLPQRVVVILVDGFGWNLVERLKNIPLIEEAYDRGSVSRITSAFPSTTSVHVTSISTNLEPIEHGIFEWNTYFPELGGVFQVLPYMMVKEGKKIAVTEKDVPPEMIFPKPTFFEELAKKGIGSLAIQHSLITDSVASRSLTAGARIESYPENDLSKLTEKWPTLMKDQDWRYCYLYFPHVDTMSHKNGPSSEIVAQTLIEVTNTILDLIKASEGTNTLFLITADHGQIDVSPKDTQRRVCLLNELPQIEAMLLSNPLEPETKLPPTGGLRNLFLPVHDKYVTTVVESLNRTYGPYLEAFSSVHLINNGIFGSSNSLKHLPRLGTVSILPRDNYAIYLSEATVENSHHLGSHGGAHPEEMIIPLIGILA